MCSALSWRHQMVWTRTRRMHESVEVSAAVHYDFADGSTWCERLLLHRILLGILFCGLKRVAVYCKWWRLFLDCWLLILVHNGVRNFELNCQQVIFFAPVLHSWQSRDCIAVYEYQIGVTICEIRAVLQSNVDLSRQLRWIGVYTAFVLAIHVHENQWEKYAFVRSRKLVSHFFHFEIDFLNKRKIWVVT